MRISKLANKNLDSARVSAVAASTRIFHFQQKPEEARLRLSLAQGLIYAEGRQVGLKRC
jgi:hypothetical protein